MRFTARRAQMASLAADIAAPSLCPAGRDMARRLATDVSSSLRQARAARKSARAIGSASAGRVLLCS
jgi:hypothetical protein